MLSIQQMKVDGKNVLLYKKNLENQHTCMCVPSAYLRNTGTSKFGSNAAIPADHR